MPDARAVYQARKEKMLAEKIDVTKFWTWFIENYPASAVQHDINSEFWNQFKQALLSSLEDAPQALLKTKKQTKANIFLLQRDPYIET